MKKHLFLSALVATALAGCTSTDVIEEGIQGNAIGFTNVVNKPSRAVEGDLNNNNFDNFLVYGYYSKPGTTTPIQIFNGVSVHKEKGTNMWTYDGTRYWVPGCTYHFYAYSCADIALSGGNGSPVFSLFDGTNPTKDDRALKLSQYRCDAIHQHDLVTAENEDNVAKEEGNQDVALKFSHALCKIRAEFFTDFPDGYKVYVSNVTVSDFFNKADFNVGTTTWNNFTNLDTQPVTLTVPANSYVVNVVSSPSSKITTSDAYFIPKLHQPTENVKLHFTIRITKDDMEILTRNIVGTWSPQWESGKVYRYNINITGSSAGIEPIVFTVEQSLDGGSWSSATALDMVFGVDADINQVSEGPEE